MKSITYATSVSSVRTVRKMIRAQALRWRARDGHIGSSQVLTTSHNAAMRRMTPTCPSPSPRRLGYHASDKRHQREDAQNKAPNSAEVDRGRKQSPLTSSSQYPERITSYQRDCPSLSQCTIAYITSASIQRRAHLIAYVAVAILRL